MDSEKKYKVPHGFRPLLEALAREVLRSQPNDIYAFSALFFERLLEYREENGVIPLEKPDLYEQFKSALYAEANSKCVLAQQDSTNEDEAKAATKIQAAFRSYEVRHHPEKFGAPLEISRLHRSHENLNLSLPSPTKQRAGSAENLSSPEENAATKIQAEIRGFLTRKHVNEMKSDMENAATKIQASYKGFVTRKHLHEQGLSPCQSPRSARSPISDSDHNSLSHERSPVDDVAASKIQAGFKGFKVRQEIKKENEAATKIQAVFKGHNTRRHLEGEENK